MAGSIQLMVVKLNVFGLSSTPAAGSLVKTGLSCLKIKSETFLISLSIGFAEQSKTSVVHMCSLFHAFILCQLWTVYLEQTIGKLVLKTYVFYSYYAMYSLLMLMKLIINQKCIKLALILRPISNVS